MAHPPVRNVPVSLMTTAGWMRASIPLKQGESLIDHIQRDASRFLSVVDAEMPRSGDRTSAVSLQRSAITLIVPDTGQEVEPAAAANAPVRSVRFFLEHGFLVGGLRLAGDTTLESFLSRHDGFFVVRDARLLRSIGSDAVRMPVVLINACRLIGVVDAKQA